MKQKTQSKTEQEPSGETGQKPHRSQSASHIQLGTLASQPPATSSPLCEQEEYVQGWGLSGATWSSDQRMSVLSKRLSASGYWEITYNKPPQTQVTQRAPRHRSTRARKHPTRQHSTEPEMTPTAWDPKATSLNPAPEVHRAPRAGPSASEGGHGPHQGRFPETSCPS